MKSGRTVNNGGIAEQRLRSEIALNRDFTGLNEVAFLSLVWTWQCLEKVGRAFFLHYGLTDAQFNAMMIMWDYRDRALRQHELADILVVNRASMGGLLERMERNRWIERKVDLEDRRAIRVRLSNSGIAKLNEVRRPYYDLLSNLFQSIDENQQRNMIDYFDTIRGRLTLIERTIAIQNGEH